MAGINTRRGAPGKHEEGHAGRADRAPIDLPLGADVPELHAERDGDAESGEQERGRLDQRFREPVLSPNAPLSIAR